LIKKFIFEGQCRVSQAFGYQGAIGVLQCTKTLDENGPI
jgi:hypothetical protein